MMPRQLRKDAILLMLLAMACAIGGFVMLFIGGVNHFVAGGLAILCFAGFFVLFNRGWGKWEQASAFAKGSAL